MKYTGITKIVYHSLQPYKTYTGKILFVYIPSLHKTEKNIENYKKNYEKEKNKKKKKKLLMYQNSTSIHKNQNLHERRRLSSSKSPKLKGHNHTYSIVFSTPPIF